MFSKIIHVCFKLLEYDLTQITNAHAEHLRTFNSYLIEQLNYFHSQLTSSDAEGSLKKLGWTVNKIRKTKVHRCWQKQNLESSDDKVTTPFLLLHQNIHRAILLWCNRLPNGNNRSHSREKSVLSTALCEKTSCFAVSHGQGIPLFLSFPDRLTRKYLLIYSNLCLFQLVDCGRTKEFLPLSQ